MRIWKHTLIPIEKDTVRKGPSTSKCEGAILSEQHFRLNISIFTCLHKILVVVLKTPENSGVICTKKKS